MRPAINFPRVAAAAVAAWIVSLAVGFVVNSFLLKEIFDGNAGALRSEADVMAGLPIGFGFMFVGFFAFAYAYAKGYEGGNGPMEGLRFGVLVAVMLNCFAMVWYYVTVPINETMIAALMVDYVVEYALYGAIVGFVYRPTVTAVHQSL